MSRVLILIWLLVQPWWSWPSLFPAVSGRLSLLICALSLGLVRLCHVNDAPMPRRWLLWVIALIGVMAYPLRVAFFTGEYFQYFIETACLSNGIALTIACAWGVWAISQMSSAWMCQMRWIGASMIVASVLFGLLGTTRALGAYSVAWTPILMTWNPWLIAIPLLGVVVAGNHVAWPGLVLAAGWMKPRWLWWILPAALCGMLFFSKGTLFPPLSVYHSSSKIAQRVQTWSPVLKATGEHPFMGWGFGPMSYAKVQQQFGARLPSVHSDWLALALFGGWPIALSGAWLWWSIVRARAKTIWSYALQGSVWAIGIMSCGQSVVSDPRIGGVMLFLLGWWCVEQKGFRHA